jgi:hypothetical protein
MPPEEQMTQNQKPIKSKTGETKTDETKTDHNKTDNQSHQPAKHIEETARLASSVENSKDPGKVQRAKD